MQALSQAKPGETYTIDWMFGVPDVLEFLHSRHVREGGTIRVIQQCRDSVLIGVQGVRLVLENEVADRIKVGQYS
nr:FeoA family protein [uncultured Mediterraneibacter sp.]